MAGVKNNAGAEVNRGGVGGRSVEEKEKGPWWKGADVGRWGGS